VPEKRRRILQKRSSRSAFRPPTPPVLSIPSSSVSVPTRTDITVLVYRPTFRVHYDIDILHCLLICLCRRADETKSCYRRIRSYTYRSRKEKSMATWELWALIGRAHTSIIARGDERTGTSVGYVTIT
jgi:hypothetical protein